VAATKTVPPATSRAEGSVMCAMCAMYTKNNAPQPLRQ
jgi:hypothetical protein